MRPPLGVLAGLLLLGVAVVCLVLPAERPVALMFEDAPRGSEAAARELGQMGGAYSQASRLQMVPRSAVQGVYEMEPLNGPARASAARELADRGRTASGWQRAPQPSLLRRSSEASPPLGNPPSSGKKEVSAMAHIEKMYSSLHGTSAQAAAAPLVHEWGAGAALARTVSGEMPLKNLEGQMQKAIHIADAQIHQVPYSRTQLEAWWRMVWARLAVLPDASGKSQPAGQRVAKRQD